MGHWQIIKPERSKVRNQIKNPSLEASTNNWTASGGTFSRSSEQSYEGAYSGKFIAGASSQNVKSNGVNVTVGQSVSLTLQTYRANSTPQGTVTIYDATNAAVRATSTISASGTWQVHELLWTNNTAGTVSVEARVTNSTADSASVIYFDAIGMFYLAYSILYFDGDTPGARWVGTPHESVSDIDPFNVYGGRQYDLEDDYYFKVINAPGAGNAPVITNYLPYAISPGGSYQNTATGVRDWALSGILVRDSRANWNLARKALMQDLNANRFGEGRPVLMRYTGGGQTRQIWAYFNGGLENEDPRADKKEFIAPRFVSTSPYFQSPNRKATLLNTETSATMQLVFARIDGLWDVLGPPDASGSYTTISALAVAPDGKVYVGGTFLNFDNQANGDYLAYYDMVTETWGTVSALNGAVTALAISSTGIVYFGGAFTNAGGVAAADYIAQWDGSSVTAVGTPNTGTASITSVNAMVFDGQGRLWVGGTFTDFANVAAADRICYWDGSNYYALGTGANNSVHALAYDAIADRIYVGGDFTTLDAISIPRAGYYSWPDSSFVAMGTGGDAGQVSALAVDATGNVYIGGTFAEFNDVVVNGICYWNGVTAVAMGSGVGTLTQVKTIAIAESGEVWIGGVFTTANGVTLIDRMAIWNGTGYYSPPIDLPGSADVNVIVFRGEDIFIGSSATGTVKFSQVTTVTNNGTEPSNPIFKFKRTGGTSCTLHWIENTTTKARFVANYSFLNGEEIVIDLRPGKKRFTSNIKNRGGSTINVASDTSDFYLIPGDNVLAAYFANDGATIAGQTAFDELYGSFD